MSSGADRRTFFKHLLREAAGVAQEMSSFLRDLESPEHEPEPWPPPPVPASPAHGEVDEVALLRLCDEVGLKQRTDDVKRLARVSVRLTRGDPGAASYLGGSPDLPREFDWPARDGRELGFLGQVDLEEVAAIDRSLPLPDEGLLLFFYDVAGRPSGLVTAHRGSCSVVHVDRPRSELERDESHQPVLRELPIAMSRELMLPGAWSFHAEALELTADEIDAWDQLRERLADRQGVELEESSADRFALHRVLGYPDELGRELEFDCELASAGFDADDVTVYYEARADHEEQAREWRLLFQLSADRTLATPREDFERLYICIRDDDLLAGNFDAAWAILR